MPQPLDLWCQTCGLWARSALQSHITWLMDLLEELGILWWGLPLKFGVWSPTEGMCWWWGASNSCINFCSSLLLITLPTEAGPDLACEELCGLDLV